jgi:hypothetical protein
MKNNETKLTIEEKRLLAQVAKQSLINHIIEQTEELSTKQLDQRNRQKESEIIELLGGNKISISHIKGVIANAMQNYLPIFPAIFYTEIYRLNNWVVPKEKFWQKPHIVAHWTNSLIYMRFSKEVLPALQQLNPYIGVGVRATYHYKWLTPDGKIKVEGFIEDAVRIMGACNTWYEFRLKYAKEYGLTIQLDLWK